MKIDKTYIEGLLIIQPVIYYDNRGYFFECYNERQLENVIKRKFVQDNEAYSKYGVIRGLHYQLPPYEQAKLIRVVSGKIFDVVVDLRKNSKTFGKWFGIILDSEEKKILYVPPGFAHGYSVLSNEAIVLYKCDNFYNKDYERGIIYSDKDLNINWMIDEKDIIISEKDKNLKEFRFAEYFDF